MNYIECFDEKRPFAWNEKPYSVEDRERIGQRYAARFTWGWTAGALDPDDVYRLMFSRVWSPGVFAGEHRSKEEFVESHWCALDFETPEYQLDQAVNDWCDSICIIGTSLNHQRPKHVEGYGTVTIDRFRILTPWERPITSLAEYEANVQALAKKYGADGASTDGARLFYPCVTPVLVVTDGYLQPVQTFRKSGHSDIDPARLAKLRAELRHRRIPRMFARFLYDGVMPDSPKLKHSRAVTVSMLTRNLVQRGFSGDEIWTLLLDGKFDRSDFDDAEMRKEFDSGLKYGLKEMAN
jgi:hypothetical protein